MGASGAALENLGDIYGTLKFTDGSNYRDRFTIIQNLPFGGIIGIQLLQNTNFQLLEDGTNVKLGKNLEPRVLGPDLIMTVKGGFEQFRCCSEALETQLSGAKPPIPTLKMETSPRNDQPTRDNLPNMGSDKPQLFEISPINSLTTVGTDERGNVKERTQSKHVGTSTCSDKVPSNADLNSEFKSNLNVGNLLAATKLPTLQHQSLRNTLLKHLEVSPIDDKDIGCFEFTNGGQSKVNFEVRDSNNFVKSMNKNAIFERCSSNIAYFNSTE